MRPVVLQYVHSDLNDLNDLPTDTHANNLEGENTPEKIAEVSDPRSLRSERSERSERSGRNSDGDGNSNFLRCYWCEKEGNKFQTTDERKYLEHGAKRHFQKPMFPALVELEKYGLKPQGREWEK